MEAKIADTLGQSANVDDQITIHSIVQDKLQLCYTEVTPERLSALQAVLEPRLPAIVDSFYAELQLIPELRPILEHSLVHRNLKDHLRHWIQAIYQPNNQAAIQKLIDQQKRVGAVHANVNVRLNQFLYGYSILKREIYGQIHLALAQRPDFAELYLFLGHIFDLLATVIGDAYFSHESIHEHNEFLLKTKGFTANTAIECERLRSSLLDWLRNALNLLYQTPNLRLDALPKLQFSNFGLWVIYKADLLSASTKVQAELKKQVEEIDYTLLQAARYRSEAHEQNFLQAVVALNDAVSKTSWYLSQLVDQLVELDTGMDPMTRLFNRRYLETIMRRQTDIARQTNLPYAILLFDLDRFKQVNDTYGHPGGDFVLKQFAELLMLHTRTSDFVFRYGGEEFLVILGNVTGNAALAAAERIRVACEKFKFNTLLGQAIAITCSAGVAVYDGHPDPAVVLNAADQALYQAKTQGRNRVIQLPGAK